MEPLVRVRISSVTYTLAALASMASAAQAHVHFDLSPHLPAGGDKIIVDGLTHAMNTNPFTELPAPSARYLNPGQRVFELELEDVGGEGYAFDPGIARDAPSAFDPDGNEINANATNLRPTSADRINVRFTRDLLRWDGDSFEGLSTGETLNLVVPGPNGDTIVAGTNLPSFMGGPQELPWVSTSDRLHLHTQTYLKGQNASTAPLDGVYLVGLQFESTVAGIAPSDEVFVVYNFNDTEENHETAVEFVETSMVPEPTGLAALALGGTALLRRRRR